MSTGLRVVEFDEDLIRAPEVQSFDCGDADYQKPLANWIRLPADDPEGPIASRANPLRQTKTFLYQNAEGELVGYGSVGLRPGEWPRKKDPKQPMSIIANVAIQRRFWNQPKTGVKYSKQILDHLKDVARNHTERLPVLVLFVHPENDQAIKCYEKNGFVPYFAKKKEGTVQFISMVALLEPVAVEAPAAIDPPSVLNPPHKSTRSPAKTEPATVYATAPVAAISIENSPKPQ